MLGEQREPDRPRNLNHHQPQPTVALAQLNYQDVPQLAANDKLYAEQPEALKPFINLFPSAENLARSIAYRSLYPVNRTVLVSELMAQYEQFPDAEASKSNIQKLASEDTFTITCAHQPNLLGGPMYIVYKCLDVIQLANQLNAKYENYKFVPVYWFGGEDHDFDELKSTQLFGQNIAWEHAAGGPVALFDMQGLPEVLERYNDLLGAGPHADALKAQIDTIFKASSNYGDFFKRLLHHLLGRFGLVIIDPMRAAFKRQLMSVFVDDLQSQSAFKLVNETIEKLKSQGFKTQAAPREVNFFYLGEGSRERIIPEQGQFRIGTSGALRSFESLWQEMQSNPERMSPNVILRPLYQSILLPDIAFVGGGGEVSYWLERKSLFEHYKLYYPIIIRRSSYLLVDSNSQKKLDKLGLQWSDLFDTQDNIVRKYIAKQSSTALDLNREKAQIKAIYQSISTRTALIDSTLVAAIEAEQIKQVKAIEQLESRLMRAEKQKHDTAIQQISALKSKLFPGDGLQERVENFGSFYARLGPQMFDMLLAETAPLERKFTIVLL